MRCRRTHAERSGDPQEGPTYAEADVGGATLTRSATAATEAVSSMNARVAHRQFRRGSSASTAGEVPKLTERATIVIHSVSMTASRCAGYLQVGDRR